MVAFRIDHRATTRLGLLPPSPDLNNDGLADVVAATDSTVAVFLGATPSLAPTPDRQVGVGELGPPLALSAAGDTNDDAFGDVLVTTMHLPDGMLLGASSAASVSLSWRNHLGVDPVPLLDVNGDGVLDEIIDLEGRAHFVFGDRIEDRLSLVSVDRTASRLRGAAPVGDVNGDGYRDVIVATEADGALRVRVFLGSATGLDRSLEASPPDGASFRSGVASAGDVNGDGLADVMVELAPSHVALYLGGSEALALHRELHPSQGDWLRVYAAGDVDGDGFGDLATLEAGSDRIRWLRGAASGLTNTPTTLVDARWSAVDAIGVPRDVDGDGFDDLVLAAPSRGVVYVLHGASTGSLNRVDTLNVAEAPAPTLRVL